MTAVETLQPAIIYLGAGLAAALASRLLTLELRGALRAMPGLRWQPT